jgi:hypothetical protein
MSDLDATAGLPFTATLGPYLTGRAAFLTIEVLEQDGSVVLGASGVGISEQAPESYTAERIVGFAADNLIVRWADDGETLGEDTLTVTALEDIVPGTEWAAPVVDELASLMFARVTGEFGQAQTFTDESRPTAGQATTKLAQAYGMVAPRVGFILDERFHDSARFLTVLYAALLLEPGYWPEDMQGDASAWDSWKTLYDEGMAALLEAIADGAGGEDTGPDDDVRAHSPVWYFGPRCDDHVPGAEEPHDRRCRRVW